MTPKLSGSKLLIGRIAGNIKRNFSTIFGDAKCHAVHRNYPRTTRWVHGSLPCERRMSCYPVEARRTRSSRSIGQESRHMRLPYVSIAVLYFASFPLLAQPDPAT